MTKEPIAIILDDRFCQHLTGPGMPECPDRYWVIKEALMQLKAHLKFVAPSPALLEDLLLCHTPEYCKKVQEEVAQLSRMGIVDGSVYLSTGDVNISPKSEQAAFLAAGAVITAVDLVMKGEARTAFCLARPPGHHATAHAGMGFCIFNNAAIGARYLQKKYPEIKRVLIVDWDVHHGNGTQDIFYDDPSVFYFSTHQKDIYPWTGHSEETGRGDAIGTTRNIPIPGGVGSRQQVLKAYQEDFKKAVESFRPDFMLISAGFDAHHLDPLGGFDLTDHDFAALTQIVKDMANQYCHGRVISLLEGGYNLQALSTVVPAHVKNLSCRFETLGI